MSLLITKDCIACDACREECPLEAIEEAEPIYVINADLCTECLGSYDEPICIPVCPIDCIVSDPDNMENAEELKLKLKKINKMYR